MIEKYDKDEATKQEKSRKLNFIEQAMQMVEKNEKILKKIVVNKNIIRIRPTMIILTNRRIIYLKMGLFSNSFKTINLADISGANYAPLPLNSAGYIQVITKNGKNVSLTSCPISQIESDDFLKELKKRIR